MTTYHSNPNDFVSVKEYCSMTGIKPITVYKKIQRGRLQVTRIGGKIYINRNHIPVLDE